MQGIFALSFGLVYQMSGAIRGAARNLRNFPDNSLFL
jgi:hypothetical protein